MIIEAIGVVSMFGFGWWRKHRTKTDHKKTGVLTNVALSAVVAGVASATGDGMTTEAVAVKGAAILATVETGLNVVKTVRRLLGR